ncbi:MAG TPA: TetR/AcrR family transcriptional regulator, partial [Mycobacterium sp.]|nr:TetR/AcrR family transcriptional regulator [Mycobacterium sp.]
MPRIWNATIDQHRRAVHDAILDTTANLIAEHGLTGVTMSQIAQHAGIGRATLYKYFPEVEAILAAWHQRQIAQHLDQLREAADAVNDPAERLRTVLRSYTELSSSRPT